MPTVSSCCGVKLRTGALLIGYFEVLISFIGIVLSALLIIYTDNFENVALCRNVSMIGICIAIQTFIVGLFLTNGIRKSDRTQIKPWVVIKGIMLCFEIGVLLLTFWLFYMEYQNNHDISVYFAIIPGIICVTGEFWVEFSEQSRYEFDFRVHIFHDDRGAIILQKNAEIPARCFIIILLIIVSWSFAKLHIDYKW